MNRISATLFAALSAMSLCAAPSVTGVSISQDASSRLVTIGYTLEGTAPAVVQVSVLTNGIPIGDAALAGATRTRCSDKAPGKRQSSFSLFADDQSNCAIRIISNDVVGSTLANGHIPLRGRRDTDVVSFIVMLMANRSAREVQVARPDITDINAALR